METALAFLAGTFVAASIYLMLSGMLIRYLLGLALISNGANLIIFAGGRTTRGEPALIAAQDIVSADTISNALPQALILTAIVISFGLIAFVLVLALRAYEELGTAEMDDMRVAEPLEVKSGEVS